MKKILALMGVCLMALTACAGSAAGETTVETNESNYTEPEAAPEEDLVYEDPVIYDFSGTYTEPTAGRCTIEIVSTGENEYTVNVRWSSSAFESSNWEMNATYYESTTLLEYTDAKFFIRTYSDEETYTDDVQYEDGAGEFWFEENGMLGWRSANSDVDGITGETFFEKLPEE